MSRKLSENEIDEIQSMTYFIKYVNCSAYLPDYDLWNGMLFLDTILNKYLIDYYDADEVKGLIDKDDVKELYEKFTAMLRNKLEI